MKKKSRFAPSPTGLLHVGNTRSALLNWAYINKKGGEFVLRIDDTDLKRSSKEFEDKIKSNLSWLGINWSKTINQSDRYSIYETKIEYLKKNKFIYPCFETTEELSLKRKSQLSSGKPPIYDRSSLNLTSNKIENFLKNGKKPHWRFKLKDQKIEWLDLIKGNISFDSKNLSDPILIREDGSLLYHLPSVIDDIEENITDIIRGEDHLTNTAFHIQIFESFNAKIPNFGHHPFLIDQEGKGFSKRLGSLSIEYLINQGFESISILNYLLTIGSNKNISKEKDIKKLIDDFEISNIATSSPKFSVDVLKILNKEILQSYSFQEIQKKFENFEVNEKFWIFVKNNIDFFHESFEWLKIISSSKVHESNSKELLKIAAELIPEEPYNESTWDQWVKLIMKNTEKKGKDLFLPLRIALTGREKGPELKHLMPLMTKNQILKKLGYIK